MGFVSHPDFSARSNSSTSERTNAQRVDGSNEQVMDNAQNNRLLTQGDQALPSHGGTGGTSGGAAGPGGGSAGAQGASRGGAGGSNGSAGGPPSGGQETGHLVTEFDSSPYNRDNITPEIRIAPAGAVGGATNAMTYPALAGFIGYPVPDDSKDDCDICEFIESIEDLVRRLF